MSRPFLRGGGGGGTVKFADKIAKICRQIMKDLPREFFSVGLET